MKNKVINLMAAAIFLTAACNKEGRVTGVDIEYDAVILNIGESMDLIATVIPANAKEKTVYWWSEKPDFVKVDNAGRITGVAEVSDYLTSGGVRIYAGTKEGNYQDYCEVIVRSQMIMTTDITGNASLIIRGDRNLFDVSIDWGDGAGIEKYFPKSNGELWVSASHAYSNSSIRTITINGSSMLRLECNDLSLTSLDVSNNTKLISIHCQNNQLSAAALNALFGTLPSGIEGVSKIVYIYGNPGTDSCEKGIALHRGWLVNIETEY